MKKNWSNKGWVEFDLRNYVVECGFSYIELGRILSVSTSTLRNWIKRGEVPKCVYNRLKSLEEVQNV